jgi:hypothetical protein
VIETEPAFRVALMFDIVEEWRVIDNWWNVGEERIRFYRVVRTDGLELSQVSDDQGRTWQTFEHS